jgi:hypothetical protein
MEHEIENRRYERIQFFLVQQEKNFLPVWVFKPEAYPSGIAAILVDVSEGGLQILTQKNALLDAKHYELTLINQVGSKQAKLSPGVVNLVWSEDVGSTYVKCGFTFLSNAKEKVTALMDLTSDGEEKFIRCVLRECTGPVDELD